MKMYNGLDGQNFVAFARSYWKPKWDLEIFSSSDFVWVWFEFPFRLSLWLESNKTDEVEEVVEAPTEYFVGFIEAHPNR